MAKVFLFCFTFHNSVTSHQRVLFNTGYQGSPPQGMAFSAGPIVRFRHGACSTRTRHNTRARWTQFLMLNIHQVSQQHPWGGKGGREKIKQLNKWHLPPGKHKPGLRSQATPFECLGGLMRLFSILSSIFYKPCKNKQICCRTKKKIGYLFIYLFCHWKRVIFSTLF